MKAIVLFLCLTASTAIAFSQTQHSFLITDQKTGEPIISAFLFIENTSTGTVSDLDGNAILPNQEGPFTIVITHLNYKTISLSSKQLKQGLNKIQMVEKVISLGTVNVLSKKAGAKKRKKWIKKFNSAFLGENISRKKVKLLNPEVLWFEEKDSLFLAHAVDNLKILNKDTGYEMQFALESFSINSNEDVKYSGKAFFKDIENTFKRKNKIKDNRVENYLQSQQLFFRSLITRHPVNQKRFEFGITKTKENETSVYQKMTYEDLVWAYGAEADTLIVEDYLTILVNDRMIPNLQLESTSGVRKINLSRPTSFMKSKSGRFIIGYNGTLLNQHEIEEFGHWTSFRIAKQLPINYVGPVVFNTNSNKELINNLLDYQYSSNSEKVYIHTDKTQYTPYSTLWFKGYIVNAINHNQATKSQVLYADLINPKNEIVKTWIFHKDKGLAGEYQWKRTDVAGEYRLIGYSNLMRNQDSAFFFEKHIELVDVAPIKMAKASSPKLVDTMQVNFYPEGGDLIAGIQTSIVFQAKNQIGQAQNIKGKIYNQEGKFITDVKSVHNGLGQFILKPELNSAYTLLLEGTESASFDLPKIMPSGLSLSVNPIDKENIYVAVSASNDELLQGAFLIGHVRGNIFCLTENLEPNKDITFPKASIPSGLMHFTLFDRQERPHAELLVFNDYNYEESNLLLSPINSKKSKEEDLDFLITLDSSSLKEKIDLSISIKSGADPTNNRLNIKNYLLFESDIAAVIPMKDYYLSNISKAKRYHLDLLLKSLYWRRFTWKDIVNKSFNTIKHPAERGYSISGYTTEKDNTKPVKSKVMLTSIGKEFIYEAMDTDENGQFSFKQLTLFDSTTYVIQSRIQNGNSKQNDELTKIEGDRFVDIHINDYSLIGPKDRKVELFKTKEEEKKLSRKTYDVLREQYLQKMEQDSSIWTIEAPEINVTATRPYTSNRPVIGISKVFFLDNMDWIKETARGTSLMTSLSPNMKYESGKDADKIYSVFYNRRGDLVKLPVTIIINGMESTPGAFRALNADRIATVYIERTLINIQTRKVPRSLEKSLESGILYVEHPGYFLAREFSPDFLVNSTLNFENTIYWNPNASFNDKGQIQINLSSLDNGNLYIDVQGISASGRIYNLYQKLK